MIFSRDRATFEHRPLRSPPPGLPQPARGADQRPGPACVREVRTRVRRSSTSGREHEQSSHDSEGRHLPQQLLSAAGGALLPRASRCCRPTRAFRAAERGPATHGGQLESACMCVGCAGIYVDIFQIVCEQPRELVRHAWAGERGLAMRMHARSRVVCCVRGEMHLHAGLGCRVLSKWVGLCTLDRDVSPAFLSPNLANGSR